MRAAILLVGALVLAGVLIAGSSSGRPAEAAQGDITGAVPANGGFGLVVWGGGSPQLMATSTARSGCGLVSVWVTPAGGGNLVGHILGAPTFVNAAFAAIYPGDLPANLPVLVVCNAIRATVAEPTPIAPPAGATATATPTPVVTGPPPAGAPTFALSGEMSAQSETQILVAFIYSTAVPAGTTAPPITHGRLCRTPLGGGTPACSQTATAPSGSGAASQYFVPLPPANTDQVVTIQLCNTVGCGAEYRVGVITRHEAPNIAFYAVFNVLPTAVRAAVFNLYRVPGSPNFATASIEVSYEGTKWAAACPGVFTCGGMVITNTTARTVTVTQTNVLGPDTVTGSRTVTLR